MFYMRHSVRNLLSTKFNPSLRSNSTISTTAPSIYNSLSKKVEPLPPTLKENGQRRPLTWYSCGPTVYDDTHLGHARSYVSTDILRRIMTGYFGYHVYYVLGMTDVDDKIIQRSNKLGVSSAVLAKKHEREFFEDLEALNCEAPNTVTRVTEHMPEIIEYIQRILDNGHGYVLDDGVYFDVNSLGDSYGKHLGTPDSRKKNGGGEKGENISCSSGGGGSDTNSKRDKRDFALWKKIESKNEVTWNSQWGKGRPGWHIECSAMTNTVLGAKFDLHSGGIDLCFPHHCNEIAQANAFNQTDKWVSTFVHTGHLHIDGLKMSKSLKNFITVRDMLNDQEELKHTLGNGVRIEDAFRMFVLSHHYRSNLTYSLDRMRDASVDLKRFNTFLDTMESYITFQKNKFFHGEDAKDNVDGLVTTNNTRQSRLAHHSFFTNLRTEVDQKIYNALSNDMDTPKVVNILREMCTQVHRYMKKHQKQQQEEENHTVDIPSELIESTCKILTSTFDHFGLQLNGTSDHGNQSNNNHETDEGSESNVAHAFATFRASVRDSARKKASPGEYFELCDHVRDVVGPTLGWEFLDSGNDVEVRKRK
jgi:cysteinyl-tRNA synthetase